MKPLGLGQSDALTVKVEEGTPFVTIEAKNDANDPVVIWIPHDRLEKIIEYMQACLSFLDEQESSSTEA